MAKWLTFYAMYTIFTSPQLKYRIILLN